VIPAGGMRWKEAFYRGRAYVMERSCAVVREIDISIWVFSGISPKFQNENARAPKIL
jgi:hypothetical protein